MDSDEVSLEGFLLKEHEQSYEQLRNMDRILTTFFWLFITLVVAVTLVVGVIIGITGVDANILIFISLSCVVLLVIGLAMLQLSLHLKDRQNLVSAYLQEMILYFMGKGLKPVGGAPRNQEVARILDFKYVYDDTHRNDWHMRRRDHIQGYGSYDEAGDAWTSGHPLANKMMSFNILILSGLVAFSVATLAGGVIWGGSGNSIQTTGELVYFGLVLGMEFFVSSWIVFRFVLKSRMKSRREFADEAFRKKREEWFKGMPSPKKVDELIKSTTTWKKEISVKDD
jgi:hypothetical protein